MTAGDGTAGEQPRGRFRPGARGGYGLELATTFPLLRVPQVHAGRHEAGASYRASRAERQRLKDINDVLDSLNWCAGHKTPSEPRPRIDNSGGVPPCTSQARAEARAAEGIDDFLNGHAIVPQRAAFLELLKGRGVYDVDTTGLTLAPFSTVAAISIPLTSEGALWLVDIAPSSALHYLESGMQRMLRSEQEYSEMLAANPVTPYWDRALLRSRRKYLRLVKSLLKRGLVGLHRPGSVKGRVGLFFVHKKQAGKVRLIIDARLVNLRFVAPASVTLMTSEGFAMVEVELEAGIDPYSEEGKQALEAVELVLGIGDIADAFHRFKIDREFAAYFGLMDVTAKEIGVVGQDFGWGPVGADEVLVPCFNSLPMGFAWSLYFCQVTAEHLVATTTHMATSTVLSDRGSPMVIRVNRNGAMDVNYHAHYVYVDNIGIFAVNAARTRQLLDSVMDKFNGVGLNIHEDELVMELGESLGNRLMLQAKESTLTRKRFWRVRRGLEYALSRRALPGSVWMIIIGHITFCALVNRDLMCLLFTCYRFARAHQNECVPLWPTARQELQAFRGLMPLLRSKWWLPWFGRPVATDASEFAYGVCFGSWPEGATATVGRVNERSRFRRLPGRSAREHFFAQSGIEQDDDGGWIRSEPAAVEWEVAEDFPEIPLPLLDSKHWTPVISRPWREEGAEDIFILELRALLRGIEALISEFSLHDCRIVCLVDNMSVALCVSRRRSKEFTAITLIRRIVAIALVHNVKVVVRWIPSETNSSDAPSRLVDDLATGSNLYSLIGGLVGRDGAETQPHSGGPQSDPTLSGRAEVSHMSDIGGPTDLDSKNPIASASSKAKPDTVEAGPSSEAFWDACSESPSSNSETVGPPDGRGRDGPDERERWYDIGGDEDEQPGEGLGGEEQATPQASRSLGSTSDVCQPHVARADSRPAQHREELRGGDSTLPQVCRRERRPARRGRRGGRRHGPVHEPAFQPWAPGTRRRGDLGRPHAFPAEVQQGRDALVTQELASTQRLEAPRAISLASCLPLPGVVRSHLGSLPPGLLEYGPLPLVDAHHIQPAVGATECVSPRSQPASAGCEPGVDSVALAIRARRALEGARQRRLAGALVEDGAVVASAPRDSDRRQARREDLCVRLPGLRSGVQQDEAPVAHQEVGPVPSPALGSQHRPVPRVSVDSRGEEPRQVGVGEEHVEVQQVGEAGTGPQAVRRKAARLLPRVRVSTRGALLRSGQGRGPAAPLTGKRFLADCFCGVGKVGKTAERRGFRCRFYDILLDPIGGDMTRESNIRYLASCAKTGLLLGIMLAPICASWSAARHRTNVIRSYAHPWEQPESLRYKPFSENDERALRIGNATMANAFRLARTVHRRGVPWILENPFTSICWQTEQAKALMATAGVHFVVVDFCAFGTAWRKRTGLLMGNVDEQDVESLRRYKCSGVGVCSYSGKRHVQLTGSDPTGIPWTKRAEPYPTRLATKMSHMLLHKEYTRRM